jgi:hypothetical protein
MALNMSGWSHIDVEFSTDVTIPVIAGNTIYFV